MTTAPASDRVNSIFRNTVFSIVARGIDVVVTFALAVILARYLGAEGFGRYTYVIAFASIFVPLVDLGLDHILIREIARHQDTAKQYVGAALVLKILIALVTLPLGMLVAWLMGHSGTENWAILLCFAGMLIFREVPTVVGYAVFLAYERMELRALVTFLFQIVRFVVTLPVVLLGGGLIPILGAALVAEASQGLMAMWLVVRKFSQPILVFDVKLWRYFVKESYPLGIAFAFNTLYLQIDILFLKHFRTAEETGLFGVPFRVVTTLCLMLIPVIWVLLPHLTRAAKESIARLDEDGRGYLKSIAVVTGAIAVYLAIEARDLTVNLFGSEYERSALVLAVISPVIITQSFLYFFYLTLTAVGKQKLVVVGSAVIFGVKLILDLVFVPTYGIMGAAFSTLAADSVCFIVMFNLTRRHVTSFGFGAIMIKPAAALATAGLVLYALRSWPFTVTFVIFGLAFSFFIWLFRVVTPNQRQFMKDLMRQQLQKVGWMRNTNVEP